MQPKVSIVVPMYNVERYLDKCVESLLAQTLSGIEIILVDDGSPDHCGKKAETYAEEYPAIRVIHRANGGLGAARNSGIDVAVGKYVGFVDSDDWVEPEMFERLYLCAEENSAQIVYGGLRIVSDNVVVDKIIHPFAGKTLRGKEDIFTLRQSFYGAGPTRVKKESTPVSACIAIYNNKMIKDNHLHFLNTRSEDILFNIDACRNAKTITFSSDSDYCYRKDGQSSITNSFRVETIDEYERFFELLIQAVDCEPLEFRKKCLLRARRRVIDYSRLLVGKIALSDLSSKEKTRLSGIVCRSHWLKDACVGYPFWELPRMQALYYLILKLRLKRIALLVAWIKKKATS